ncbi:hypothetical protein HUE58_02695 [Candidatus Ruthia endofausta]|uniref:UDP-N-acetylglucosamine kinase n=1 Tax=Candidatus Ruthia endofausta TaxID=2738852 RepID=A0A6N0HP83_9GAMM|nr:hypothetical protein [Candidatus Ruthia endofausta]QKQ24080.1 hypothetical protein HUE58_02695 [Candidatus Ruthia endofausta]
MQSKPVLIIIAGPNGTGKTTITEQLLTHSWLDNTTYINPDIIAQEKFGGWNSKKSFIEAAKKRNECIKNKNKYKVKLYKDHNPCSEIIFNNTFNKILNSVVPSTK